MSNFSNYKKFENVGIRSSNDTLIIMNSSNNNISFHSSDGGDDNVDTLSIKNIINKTPNEDLNLSSINGTTINPVIKINNNHSDCRIMTNLNVNGNVNINNNLIIPNYNTNSNLLSNIQGSIYYNTSENKYKGYTNEGWISLGLSETNDTTIHKNLNVNGNINLTNGEMIQTSGIGSFGSINCDVYTYKNLNISGNLNLPVGLTSSRPSNPSFGTIRFNSEIGTFEGYSGFDGGLWINLTKPLPETTFIELVLLGGGGGGGDGNPQGGGGGGGAVVQASGTFPINVSFTLQLGGGGKGPNDDNSGSAGHMTQLTGDGFDLRAYGGGFGGSYSTGPSTSFYDNTKNGGPGGGGAGPSPNGGSTSGATAGTLGTVTNSIISDLQTSFFGGNGGNFYTPGDNTKAYPGQGGHGGGAGGNATNTQWGSGNPRNPIGETSGSALWDSNLNWGRGGYGGPPTDNTWHAGHSSANNLYNAGAGGAGSSDKPYGNNTSDFATSGQHGRMGAAIINVPAGISISITESIPNLTTSTASVNGGTSYAFYDSRWYLTTGGPSGSFTISFTNT